MSAAAGDLLLDPDTGDLALEYGDLVVSSGSDAVLQSIRQRLGFFKGEWFADENIGVPYWDSILIKNPSLPAIRELFRQEILNSPGVASVESISLDYTGTTRSLALSFTATADDGSLLTVDGLQVEA